MAFINASRVAETSTFTGSTTITLAGVYVAPNESVATHRTFSAVMADQDTAEIVAVADNGAWQRMQATYNLGANTLTRGLFLESSTGANVVFAVGNKIVFLVDPTFNFTVSATAPSSPSANDLWYDTTNGRLCIYYSDGVTSAWLQDAEGEPDFDAGSPTTLAWDFYIDGGAPV